MTQMEKISLEVNFLSRYLTYNVCCERWIVVGDGKLRATFVADVNEL